MMVINIVIVLVIVVGNCLCRENYIDNSLIAVSRKLNSSEIINIPVQCSKQMEVYINKLLNTDLYDDNWAWQMFDSSSKITDGLLTGNRIDFGNFDECIDINTFDSVVIKGKYCAVALVIPLSIFNNKTEDPIETLHKSNISKALTSELQFYQPSICIPHHCTPEDIAVAIGLTKEMSFNNLCTTKEDIGYYDGIDWTFIAFIITIMICIISSTVYDLHIQKHKKDAISKVVLAFSLYTNGRTLFKTTKNDGQIKCLNGLRVLSTMWVIVLHRYAYFNTLPIPIYNNNYRLEWVQKVYTQYVQAGVLSVDTFIFMTGIVTTYSFIRTQSKPNAKFNVFMYYLHRYLRLTPVLAVMYFLQVTWVRHLGSGPLWKYGIDLLGNRDICTERWWSYFLYIQNYFDKEKACLSHTWYISLDMQIYILSPLLLIPLVKYAKYMKYAVPFLACLSVISPIVTIYYYDAKLFSKDYWDHYYFQTHNRISPWFVGVMVGYYLVNKDKRLQVNKIVNLILWTFVLVGMTTIIYFLHYYTHYNYHRAGSAIFIGVYQLFWSVGLSWIVLACHNGYGGIINWMLSLPIFEIVGKISYSMYIIHMVVILRSVFTIRTKIVWGDYNLIYLFIGDITIIMFFALFMALLIEYPVLILDKLLFSPKGSKLIIKKDVTNTA